MKKYLFIAILSFAPALALAQLPADNMPFPSCDEWKRLLREHESAMKRQDWDRANSLIHPIFVASGECGKDRGHANAVIFVESWRTGGTARP